MNSESTAGQCEIEGLTPYQGQRRSFGFFLCPYCKVEWTSDNSYANMYQKCETCDTAVYPHKQLCEQERITPYQGQRRSFGFFLCPYCKVEWTSENSYANMYQKCETCDMAVYPHKQFRQSRCTGHGETARFSELVPVMHRGAMGVLQDSVGRLSETPRLTPYQGERRSFRFFLCPYCKVEWTSEHSNASMYQKCETCDMAVYPYKHLTQALTAL